MVWVCFAIFFPHKEIDTARCLSGGASGAQMPGMRRSPWCQRGCWGQVGRPTLRASPQTPPPPRPRSPGCPSTWQFLSVPAASATKGVPSADPREPETARAGGGTVASPRRPPWRRPVRRTSTPSLLATELELTRPPGQDVSGRGFAMWSSLDEVDRRTAGEAMTDERGRKFYRVSSCARAGCASLGAARLFPRREAVPCLPPGRARACSASYAAHSTGRWSFRISSC